MHMCRGHRTERGREEIYEREVEAQASEAAE